MNTKEIQEQLQDSQELTIKLGERLNSAEEILTKLKDVKDYTRQLEELKELVIKNAEQEKTTPIRQEMSQQVITIENLMLTIEASIKRQEIIFKDFPKKITVKLLHRFEDKTKGFIIGSIILLILLAAMTGICLHLWSDNGKMRDNNVKFRMIRQMAPNIAFTADTLYHVDPEGMERKTEKLEAEQLAIAQAEAIAKEIAEKAAQAKKEAKQLRKNKIPF
jgi:hypothetical protein